jgi:hypothetical protein
MVLRPLAVVALRRFLAGNRGSTFYLCRVRGHACASLDSMAAFLDVLRWGCFNRRGTGDCFQDSGAAGGDAARSDVLSLCSDRPCAENCTAFAKQQRVDERICGVGDGWRRVDGRFYGSKRALVPRNGKHG